LLTASRMVTLRRSPNWTWLRKRKAFPRTSLNLPPHRIPAAMSWRKLATRRKTPKRRYETVHSGKRN
jgi:hypothetical protein